MARTEKNVVKKKKESKETRRKSSRSSSSSNRHGEPLHVDLLRSAGVVMEDIDGGELGLTAGLASVHAYQGHQRRPPRAGLLGKEGKTQCVGSAGRQDESPSDSDAESKETSVRHCSTFPDVGADRGRRRLHRRPQGEGGLLVPAALSQKILRLADDQQRTTHVSDEDSEDGEASAAEDGLRDLQTFSRRSSLFPGEKIDADGFIILDQDAADSAEEEEDELYVHRKREQQQTEEMPANGEQHADPTTPSLVENILKKLRDKEAVREEPSLGHLPRPSDPGSREGALASSHVSSESNELPPKVVEVYTAMAPFLARYRSGKLPKAFKVLPRLQQWEEALMLTQPQSWSPHALSAATKIFCSNLSSNAVQRFLCLVLLPALRDDIAEHKKLNYHLYQALKKALFKPAAFFKGIFLPLALEGCSRKEAVIVGSVVAKMSISVLHGAAALLRLSLVPPSQWLPPVSLLMAVLINKKYSLPAKAVQACVLHFHRFRSHAEKLPVSWHRAFLSFVQRYKLVLAERDRSRLHEILRIHFHELIGPAIRRELLAKNPAAVLEQQALLLEQRQQQQQNKHQHNSCRTGEGETVMMEVEE